MYLFFLVILFYLQLTQEVKYLFVYEHCRHGARSPIFSPDSTYTDEYGTKWFGDGELTSIGMRMHHVLGIRNRLKYSGLYSPNFNSKEIIITSSNSNRTMNSIQAQLFGMFPPGTGEILQEEEIKYSYPPNKLSDETKAEVDKLGVNVINGRIPLIPIHNFDLTKNYVFLNEPSICPNMKQYIEELKQKSTLQTFLEKINNTYGEELQAYFKKPNRTFIFDMNVILSITDNFISNVDNGKDLSKFKEETKIDMDAFYKMAVELKNIFLYQLKVDKKTSILTSTPYFRDILIWMRNRIDLDKEGKSDHINYTMPKMVIHSGHDTSVGPIEFFMNTVFDTEYKYVAFASNIFFELFKDDNNNYKVSYLVDDELMLTINFEDFAEKIEKVLWSEEEIINFCGIKKNTEDNESLLQTLLILTIVFGSTTLLLLISTIFLYFWMKHKESKRELEVKKASLIPDISK